jgi:RNA polymerase sigma factor (sigma-70 family)
MQRDLVTRAITRDREAYSELARLWIDRLFALARVILPDLEWAQDATQEAIVAGWRDISSLRDPDSFGPWMRRVLVRECYREAARHRTRQRFEALVRAPGETSTDPGHALADRDEVERALQHLSAEHRAILALRYLHDLPVEEVATTLGLPEGTVKSRLHRATRLLRAELDAGARSQTDPLRRPT